jgi:hypothetical protein
VLSRNSENSKRVGEYNVFLKMFHSSLLLVNAGKQKIPAFLKKKNFHIYTTTGAKG